MNEYISVNPERIKWCCNKYGISDSVLAHKLGVNEEKIQTIFDSNQVQPKVGLTFRQLEKLAQTFSESILFFINNEPVIEENLLTPQFRTMESQIPNLDIQIKKIIENVVSQQDLYISLLEELGEELLGFSPIDLNDLSLEKAALKVRKWLDIPSSRKLSFKDYREKIESKGILVFVSNGYSGSWKIPNSSKILGFSFYHEKVPVIFVKKDNENSDNQSVFTLMHELAHILIHKKTIIDSTDVITSDIRIEKEANEFASNILVTSSMLDTIDDDLKPDNVQYYRDWVKNITSKYSVSTDVVLLRLLKNGRVSQREYNEYREYCAKERDFYFSLPVARDQNIPRRRYLEPKQIFGESYVRVILDALQNNIVTLSKASNYLDGLKIKSIKELERSIYG